ncbi:hypothetical protein M0804_000453 [Polistes exclamans]|nr:hypothetical protein M0804_000453 [Polistes exclamans]
MEKKNIVRVRVKSDAIQLNRKDQNMSYTCVLKLMKSKVNEQQVAENVNKIRLPRLGYTPRYRTISLDATLIHLGISPIWLLGKERARVWERQQREDESATRLDIKKEAHAALMRKCQGEWNSYPKDRWTHTLIRDVQAWTTREHRRLNYWTTQVLSGHGCFGAYLHKYKRRRSEPTCQECSAEQDDAEHVFFRCRAYTEIRTQLQQRIGEPLEPETLVEAMLRGLENWDKNTRYFR